jgi:hypothetical protein
MLFMEDPQIKTKMETVAVEAMDAGDEEIAFAALYLIVYWARENGVGAYERMLAKRPAFQTLPLAAELDQVLQEQGFVILFE